MNEHSHATISVQKSKLGLMQQSIKTIATKLHKHY